MPHTPIKSDVLPQLAQSFRANWLAPYWKVRRIRIVLDANIALTDVAWMAKRREASGRTELREVLNNNILKAYAPTFLKTEMASKIPIYAKDQKIDPEKMWREWEILQGMLHFHDEGEADARFGHDPKDAPYVRLAKRLRIRVLTLDTDIKAMGAKVLQRKAIGHITLYSRHVAAEYQLKLVGLGSVGILIPFAQKVGLELWKKYPGLVLMAIAAIGAYALSNSSRRENITCTMKKLGSAALQYMEEHNNAKKQASAQLIELDAME
jgi:predicted nucleic acid-binding protein